MSVVDRLRKGTDALHCLECLFFRYWTASLDVTANTALASSMQHSESGPTPTRPNTGATTTKPMLSPSDPIGQSSSTSSLLSSSHHDWTNQLITKEDPRHVHKTLGILALCSFAWRMSQLGETDMGFTQYPAWTLPTLFLHLSLSTSSFIFAIPAKRISTGYRIWPEYRLHSIIFTCRSLAFMALFWTERQLGLGEHHLWNLVLILATMAAAEIASSSQGHYRSGFSRELNVNAITKYFFSVAQLAATAMCLVGQRRYTMQFLMVFIVQGTVRYNQNVARLRTF